MAIAYDMAPKSCEVRMYYDYKQFLPRREIKRSRYLVCFRDNFSVEVYNIQVIINNFMSVFSIILPEELATVGNLNVYLRFGFRYLFHIFV